MRCVQVSFANAICTTKGGTHVNYIADQVVKHVCELLGKKHKQVSLPWTRSSVWKLLGNKQPRCENSPCPPPVLHPMHGSGGGHGGDGGRSGQQQRCAL